MPLKPDPDSPDGARPARKAAAKPKPETVEFDLFPSAAPRRPKPAPAAPRPEAKAAAQPQPQPSRRQPDPTPVRTAKADPEPVVEEAPVTPRPSAAAPSPAPTPVTAAPAAAAAPLSSSPVQPTSTGTRPMAHSPNLEDFRRNADRQSREQKSFGNVLATITYSILVAFILVTGLAAYGGYILFQRIKLQSESIAELDRRYEAEVVGLKEDQNRAHDEIERISDDLARQQEQIARLRAIDDKLTSDLAAEHSANATLKARLDQITVVH